MRITFIAPRNLSGGVRVIAIHAERLRRRGHDVLVVSPPPRRPTARAVLRSLARGRGWPPSPGAGPSHFDGAGVECRVLDRRRPVTDADVPDADAVVATWWETAEWVAALSPRKGAKVYFLQGLDTYPPQPAGRVEATWDLPMHRVVVSRWLADLAGARGGGASLVPNAVDLDQFRAPPRRRGRPPTVGLVYSPAPIKGADVSLRAFALCAERDPSLRLVAFGAKPPSASLPLPPGAEFHLRPPQGAIREIYARCDAWLFGSRREGFGLPILEAMACRTPVVATPAGAAPELLAGGGGVLVAPEDPRAMADGIGHVLGLPDDEWAAMSAAAHATATSYTWDDAADRFERALERAVAGAGAAASPSRAGGPA